MQNSTVEKHNFVAGYSTFVIGDIHGGYKSLRQCLDRSKFDYKKDRLIVLGDVCDGFPDTKRVITELLKIKNLVLILGNHDVWARDWMENTIKTPSVWTRQGGRNTLTSYGYQPIESHKKFLQKALPYFIDESNRLFVHGGYKKGIIMEEQKVFDLIWDRELVFESRRAKINNNNFILKGFNEVYVGHTSTWSWSEEPYNSGNLWCLDQGGGYEGKLSIMNIDTKEFWQSDLLRHLYPGLFFSNFI